MKSNIFLDRAVLLNIAIEYSKNKIAPNQSLILKSYKRILFETGGMSAIIYTLEKIHDISQKLVSIRFKDINENHNFESSFKILIDYSCKNIEIIHAFKIFCKKSNQAESSIHDTITYIFQLIFISNKYNSDIFMWKPRFELFKEILLNLGYSGNIQKSEFNTTVEVDFSTLTQRMFIGNISPIRIHLFADQITDNNSDGYKSLIFENKQQTLLKILLRDERFNEYHNELVILLGNLTEIKRRDLIQAISREEVTKGINTININILSIIDSIKTE